MKRYLVLAGMILLGAVIYLYEEKPRVETGESHIPSLEFSFAKLDLPHLETNSHFLDGIHLSYEPMAIIRDNEPTLASLAEEKDLPSARVQKLRPQPVETATPVFTVADSKLNIELLGAEGFSLKLNLTPAYPNPEALIPTRLDPGVGMSIKF